MDQVLCIKSSKLDGSRALRNTEITAKFIVSSRMTFLRSCIKKSHSVHSSSTIVLASSCRFSKLIGTLDHSITNVK